MTDDNLLARRSSLPGRICPRSHLPRRHSYRHSRKRWHRPRRRTQSHKQVIRTRHISWEAVYSEWV